MDEIERLVRTWIATGRSEEIDETVAKISGGEGSFLHVVKALGEYLTAEEDVLRGKGVDFLSSVIVRCPPESVNRQATRTLVKFLCEKLDDFETVIPALKGLLPLTSLPTFSSLEATEVFTALVKYINMKAHVQATRFIVFSIVDSLMARHREALKDMGKGFLTGYAELADGEKDPRNLMVAFAIDRVLCIEFNISDHVEVWISTLFNIIFCYFPITFKPPPDDPYGITTEDLKMTLKECMIASPSFGELAIPLFLEKLLAGSPATKRDTLQTMAYCLPTYGAGVATKHFTKLWNSLKIEIFQPTDAEAEDMALDTLRSLMQTIHKGLSVDSVTEEGFAKSLCEECLETLREPEKSMAKPAAKVLAAMVSSSAAVAKYTLSQAIPFFFTLFRSRDEETTKPQVLTLINVLLVAAGSAPASGRQGSDSEEHILDEFKEILLSIYCSSTKVEQTAQAALSGLKIMINIPSLLTNDDLQTIVETINEALTTAGEVADGSRNIALIILIAISTQSSKLIEQSTLPLLFSKLPDQAPARDRHEDRQAYQEILESLMKLCIPAPLFETCVIRLSTKLDLLYAPRLGQDIGNFDLEANEAYAFSILQALNHMLNHKVATGDTDVPKYLDRLVSPLYVLFISLALREGSRMGNSTDSRVLKAAASVITLVIATVSVERQIKFANALVSAFTGGEVADLLNHHQLIKGELSFNPLKEDAPQAQKDLITLFSAGVISLRKEVKSSDDLSSFVASLLAWGIKHTDNDLQRQSTNHALASLINKRVEDLPVFLDEQLDSIWKEAIVSQNLPSTLRHNAIQSWAWICKALQVRNHARAMPSVDRIFDIFSDEALSGDAARTLGLIGAGGEHILTKSNHAVLKALSTQKFFNHVLTRVMTGLDDGSGVNSTAYLVALASLLSTVPQTIYSEKLSALLPYLLRGLELSDNSVRSQVIEILISTSSVIDQASLAQHASTLVSSMLKNSSVEHVKDARLRLKALKYLGIIPELLRYDVLHPHKSTVIRQLGHVLDDPRRAVRKEAVNTRTIWYTYNGVQKK